MEEIEKFLKENNICCYYIYENKLQLFIDTDINSKNIIYLFEIINFSFEKVTVSVPFTYGNPYMLVKWGNPK